MCKDLRTPRWKQSEYRIRYRVSGSLAKGFIKVMGQSTEEMCIEKKFQVSSRNVQRARVAFASTEPVDYIITKKTFSCV